MKLAVYQIVLALSLASASQVSAQEGSFFRRLNQKCAGRDDFCDCAVCEDYTTDPITGVGSVTISVGSCSKTSLSWMCCAGTAGANGACAVESSSGGKQGKKENTGEIVVTDIPAGATEVVVQIHDGDNGGDGILGGPSNFCAGNAGGPCNKGLCERTFILSDDCGHGGGMNGDPHIKNWAGQYFDYHGECDLILMSAPKFDGKQDLDVHVRTTIEFSYSYIEAAAVRIGDDIFEIGSYGEYSVNGVEDAVLDDNVTLPTIGGYPLYHEQVSKKKHVFDIVIAENENITLSNFKSWVSVKVENAHADRFSQVSGLMGTFEGKMLTHDGLDLHDDLNALGQDWQIKDGDAKLFRTLRAPQWPQQCRLPEPHSTESRRLE